MKRYFSVMAQIWPWYVQEIFVNRFKVPARIKLPVKIQNYSLVKVLSAKSFPFGTGLYKNALGKEVVIKVWIGKSKNIYYFNLVHQIDMMRVLTAAQKRLSVSQKNNFAIPRYVHSIVEPNKVILIMEKADGKPMENIKHANAQFAIYKKCLIFMRNLSKTLTKTEREVITTKSVWDFLFLYPFILFTAILVQPELLATLVKGLPAFLRGIPELVKIKPNTLVHGDMHPDNILVQDHKFYLIDVENMRLCYKLYEPVSTVSLKGNTDKFKQLVIDRYLLPAAHKATASLIVNNATHNLSGDKNPAGVASYKQAINLAFKI